MMQSGVTLHPDSLNDEILEIERSGAEGLDGLNRVAYLWRQYGAALDLRFKAKHETLDTKTLDVQRIQSELHKEMRLRQASYCC